jgi:hypothetical protein
VTTGAAIIFLLIRLCLWKAENLKRPERPLLAPV